MKLLLDIHTHLQLLDFSSTKRNLLKLQSNDCFDVKMLLLICICELEEFALPGKLPHFTPD